jgi:para-aminobenzoate synthetase / 4-amino-4-deoxychorismate lyase
MAPRIIIDFPNSSGQPGRRAFRAPQRIISTDDANAVMDALREVEVFCAGGATAVGFIAYEAASAFDAAFRTHAPGDLPLLWFAIFEQEFVAAATAPATRDQLNWQIDLTRAQHERKVARIREEIAAGSTYQVNFTTRMRAHFAGDAHGLYEAVRPMQGAGYHAFIETADWCVVSLSPELFFEVEGRSIRSRPMKGTRGRGRFSAEDEVLAAELRDSAKERAENLMIVDLMRNDVGRVAETGSVHVTSLYDVERYPTVHQLTSTVEATLRDEVSFADVMCALFPAGSVTGAPKISTMRLLSELEQSARGIYCGAIGIVERNRCTFNVPIRTIWIDRRTQTAEYGTGGGITADSVAKNEYNELLTKALVVSQSWPSFELLETMRLENGEIVRLTRHLRRLEESAEYFGFPYCHDDVLASLTGHTGTARVRLLLDAKGAVRCETQPLDAIEPLPRVVLALGPVSSRDRFLFHKTTHRRQYEKHVAGAPEYFDVLLWNERDELTEFTRGNVVLEIDGERVTPQRESGLLAGVMRGELLDQGVIVERIITKPELMQATRIWFINSVRGWVEVQLA